MNMQPEKGYDDIRLVGDIPTQEIFEIIADQLPHHPTQLARPKDWADKVKAILPAPETQEKKTQYLFEGLFRELSRRMQAITGSNPLNDKIRFISNGKIIFVTEEELVMWEAACTTILHSIPLIDSDLVQSLLEIHGSIKATQMRIHMRRLITELLSGTK